MNSLIFIDFGTGVLRLPDIAGRKIGSVRKKDPMGAEVFVKSQKFGNVAGITASSSVITDDRG